MVGVLPSVGMPSRVLRIRLGSTGAKRSLLMTAGCCDERLGDAACVFVDVNQLARTVTYRNLLRLHGLGDFPD